MSKFTTQEIQEVVRKAIPPGVVLPRHNENGHFYEVADRGEYSIRNPLNTYNPVYESVTGKLKAIKDESIMTFMMNEALRYVRGNYQHFNETNIETHLTTARQASADIRDEAGDLGTAVHDARERFFSEWIQNGQRPTKPLLDYLESDMGINDPREISCLRALDKFIADYRYEPIITELLVYSHKLKTAGTLDDIGWVWLKIREGDPNCEHDLIGVGCAKCDLKYKKVLALIDLKTSNQIKGHYFLQVALYYEFFRKLTGIKIDKFYILKLSKVDGSYQLQEIKSMGKIIGYAKNALKLNDGMSTIKKLMKKPAFKL